MKRKAMIPIVLVIVGIILSVYGMLSYEWYLEHRETQFPGDEANVKTDLSYGIRGVHNHTRLRLNGTTLEEETKVHSYDEFLGEENLAGPVASTTILVLTIGIIMAALFIPLAFVLQSGELETRIGKWGPYIPLYVAQVAAFTLVVSPIVFSYGFITALDADMYDLTDAPSQALGDMSGWWVIFGGLLIQVAAFMAISRTRLIYIEPLDEIRKAEALK